MKERKEMNNIRRDFNNPPLNIRIWDIRNYLKFKKPQSETILITAILRRWAGEEAILYYLRGGAASGRQRKLDARPLPLPTPE